MPPDPQNFDTRIIIIIIIAELDTRIITTPHLVNQMIGYCLK